MDCATEPRSGLTRLVGQDDFQGAWEKVLAANAIGGGQHTDAEFETSAGAKARHLLPVPDGDEPLSRGGATSPSASSDRNDSALSCAYRTAMIGNPLSSIGSFPLGSGRLGLICACRLWRTELRENGVDDVKDSCRANSPCEQPQVIPERAKCPVEVKTHQPRPH